MLAQIFPVWNTLRVCSIHKPVLVGRDGRLVAARLARDFEHLLDSTQERGDPFYILGIGHRMYLNRRTMFWAHAVKLLAVSALQIILDLCIPEKEFAKTRSQISCIYFQSHSWYSVRNYIIPKGIMKTRFEPGHPRMSLWKSSKITHLGFEPWPPVSPTSILLLDYQS